MTNKLVCLVLLGCFGLFQTVYGVTNEKSAHNPTCSFTPCICCLENVTCLEGLCGGQCKDGHHGGRCHNDCPINCVTCKDRDKPNNNTSFDGVANCTYCKPGYYSTSSFFQCQFNCSAGCADCSSEADCISCKAGYYKSSTTCSKCPNECASCNTPNQCTQCNDGLYNSGDINGYRNCTICSEGCWKKTCNNESGLCNCTSTNYSGDKCDKCAQNIEIYPHCNQCIAGFYGTDCQHKCPVNCNRKVCNRHTGHCTDGCNTNFTGDNCTFCKDGLYGLTCDEKCPVNCANDTCNQSSGYCQGCESNFAGETCNSCKPGQYGIDCKAMCPTNCNASICNRSTGNCYACIHEQSGDKCCMQGKGCLSCSSEDVCSECVPGKHGDQCDKECPANCVNNICSKGNGTCIACPDGFHGDNCKVAASRTTTGPDVPVGAVAGGVIGGLVVISATVILLIFFKRRSGHKNDNNNTMAHSSSLTTEGVYANDSDITEAIKEFNTCDTVTNTYAAVTDVVPPSLGASWKKSEEMILTTEMPDANNKLDAFVKSDKADRLDKSGKQDKPVKPEIAVKLGTSEVKKI